MGFIFTDKTGHHLFKCRQGREIGIAFLLYKTVDSGLENIDEFFGLPDAHLILSID